MREGAGHQDDVHARRSSNFNRVNAMKIKILAPTFLSLIGWAVSAGSASAWELFPCCFHRHYSVIICRPYNAFTPICCGNMVCDGCCPSPFSCGSPCAAPIQRCLPPMCAPGCGDYAYASPTPMMSPMMAPSPTGPGLQAPPAPGGPGFAPPPPTPAQTLNQAAVGVNPQAMYGVQPVGYNPNYYPQYPMNYYPVNYNPNYNYPMAPAVPVPYYWYNGR
jgi:hypothetical protein